MIISVSGIVDALKAIDDCPNEVMEWDREKNEYVVDNCNCEQMCPECAERLFHMLVWTRDEDKETVVSA